MRFDSWTHPDHIELVVEAPLSRVIGSIGIPRNYGCNCESCSNSCCKSCCKSYCKSCSSVCHCCNCGGNETQFFIFDTNNKKYTVEKENKYCCCPPEIKTYKIIDNARLEVAIIEVKADQPCCSSTTVITFHTKFIQDKSDIDKTLFMAATYYLQLFYQFYPKTCGTC